MLGGGGGGGLLPLRGFRDGAAIDEGHVPRCGAPVLGSAVICICRALQQAVSFAVSEREVARGSLDGFQECGPSVGPKKGPPCLQM